jgi:parallel beta-helix repeat protein
MALRDVGTSALRVGVVVVVLVTVVVATAFAGLQIGGGPPEEGGPTPIDSCTTLSSPGAYELARDLENRNAGACIRITASNVTFDGNGHRIDGVGAFGSGGVIVGSLDRGIANVSVSNVTVTDWDDGLRYLNVSRGRVEGTTTANNRIGLSVLNSTATTVTNTTAAANELYGVSVTRNSKRTLLTNNTARANTLFGFHLVGVGGTTVMSNRAAANEYGIALIDADRNRIVRNNVSRNRIAGIWLSAADRNEVVDNYVSNRFYGIYLSDRSTRNRLVANTAVSNAVGVRLVESRRNLIERNAIRDNRAEAILLLAADSNRLGPNRLADNGRAVAIRNSENVTGPGAENTSAYSVSLLTPALAGNADSTREAGAGARTRTRARTRTTNGAVQVEQARSMASIRAASSSISFPRATAPLRRSQSTTPASSSFGR